MESGRFNTPDADAYPLEPGVSHFVSLDETLQCNCLQWEHDSCCNLVKAFKDCFCKQFLMFQRHSEEELIEQLWIDRWSLKVKQFESDSGCRHRHRLAWIGYIPSLVRWVIVLGDVEHGSSGEL